MMAVVVRHPACPVPNPADPAHDAGLAPDAWGECMARAQAGDRDTYHALLRAISPYLRAIARRMLGPEDAEDAVQDILLVVHQVRHTYQPGRPFKPWLATIASRRCVDVLRRRSRDATRLGDGGEIEGLLDEAPGPVDWVDASQQRVRVRDAVAQLSPGQRNAVRLLHLQELSLHEAQSQATHTPGALKVASHRALKALRRALQGERPHEP